MGNSIALPETKQRCCLDLWQYIAIFIDNDTLILLIKHYDTAGKKELETQISDTCL